MNMFKVVRMSKRGALSPEDFRERLGETGASAPLRKVLSVSTGEVALGGTTTPFDGMAALYYPTLEAARAALMNAMGRWPDAVVCDEHLMSQKPQPRTSIKIIRTVYRRRDLTHAQFKDYWLKSHSTLEARVIAESPVQKIVATFAIPEPGRDPAFDGMVELYFASLPDIRAMFAGPIPAMMRKDEENFVQMDAPAIRFVAEEIT
jgi:uncharacterized protein (TIGR02118 family)